MEYLSCDPGSCVGIWFYGGVAGAFKLDGIFCKFKFGCTGGVAKDNITFIESNIVFMTSNLSRISAYNGIPCILPARNILDHRSLFIGIHTQVTKCTFEISDFRLRCFKSNLLFVI